MINLSNGGVYLLHGSEIIPDNSEAPAALKARTGREITKAEATQNTIAYGILKSHNTSGNMEKLKIKFDKLISHDPVPCALCADQLPQFPVCRWRHHQRG